MVSEMPELLLMTFLLLSNCHGRIGGTRKKATALKMDLRVAQPRSNTGLWHQEVEVVDLRCFTCVRSDAGAPWAPGDGASLLE